MKKIIYQGHDITESIARKEKKIIELYSQKRHISFGTAEKRYLNSTLLDVMRDVENDLWTHSEQYIVHEYSDALDEVKIKEPQSVKIMGINKKANMHYVKVEKSLESLRELIPKPEHIIMVGKRSSQNRNNKVGVAAARSIHGEKIKK